jgi:hypothetical protein
MFTVAADYLGKSWQHCPGVLREFSWKFSFPSLEFFQDLGGCPYQGISSPLNNLESTSGKNFKKEKEKFFLGSTNKFLRSANGFSRIRKKW